MNRGVAYDDHRVFRGTADGRVLAYDARSGKRLWATPIADQSKGESVPAAPIAWNGMVFIGNAGGDNKGVKGRIYALDQKDGHIVWEFYMVPKAAGDTARGPAPPKNDAEAASWKNAGGVPITGGATWTSYSLDPVTGMLYVPGGNPAPDFVKESRQGDNLYASSIVVLDAKTGAYQRHYQLVKRDFHDWDVSSAPALFLSGRGHRMLAEAPKDGHLYLIDLTTGKTIFKKPVTTITNAEAPLTSQGTRFCPGTQGGAEWNGAVFDPADNVIFTGEVDWCSKVTLESPKALAASRPMASRTAAPPRSFGKFDDQEEMGRLVDRSRTQDTGEKKWQFKAAISVAWRRHHRPRDMWCCSVTWEAISMPWIPPAATSSGRPIWAAPSVAE